MADRLLDEFPPVSKTEWLEKIKRDLKGKPYEKLVRVNDAGIPIAPVYTADDLPAGVAKSFPGQDDLRRGERPLMGLKSGGWLVCQDFPYTSLADFMAFTAQLGAADSVQAIRLLIAQPTVSGKTGAGLRIHDWSDLAPIVQWAHTHGKQLLLEAGANAIDFLKSDLLGKISGGLDLNPLLHAQTEDTAAKSMDQMLARIAEGMPKLPQAGTFKLLTLSLQNIELAGANAAQQIAFALAMATDLADRLEKYAITPESVFKTISIQFPITTDFFGEMAKLRAFRVLWGKVLEAWGLDAKNPAFTHLQAIPAVSTETVADPHVNLLRHTTQAMAAIMGGCTLLSLPAYDAQFGGANVDAARTARNIQLVLREEAYLGKTMDAGGGAYFVESLTDELAAKSWAIFQEIEAAGGWHNYSRQNLSTLLVEGKRRRLAAVRSGAKTLLGTNHFANERETIATPHAIPAAGLGITLATESADRLAAPFERVRLQLQAASSRQDGIQNVLLFTLGDPVLRAARANFARNVLAAGGYVCTENQHPTDLKAAVAAAKTLQPSVIVLCGADADYFEKGREWLDAIRNTLPAALLVLAGKPDGWEQLQAGGIAEPIFAGMDRVAFLERLLEHVQQRKEVRS